MSVTFYGLLSKLAVRYVKHVDVKLYGYFSLCKIFYEQLNRFQPVGLFHFFTVTGRHSASRLSTHCDLREF